MVNTIQSPAKKIKYLLTKEFKGIEFSVTTDKPFINIGWEIDLGSSVLEENVRAICYRYDERNNKLMKGWRIIYNPKFSDMRKFWSVKYVQSLYPVGLLTYTHRLEELGYAGVLDNDGMPQTHYEASDKLDFYLENGIVSNLTDSDGSMPEAKYEYYLKLAEKLKLEKKPLHPHEYHNICDDLCSMVKKEQWQQAVNLLESRTAIEMLHIIGLIHDYSFLTQDEINQLCRHVGSNHLKLM